MRHYAIPRWRILALACLLTALTPLLVIRVPPLLDFPNHLARYYLLGGGLQLEPLSHIYAADWSILTNIGFDLIAVPLGRILPTNSVGTVFVLLAHLLPPLGVVVLNRTLFGGWHWWQYAAGLVIWNLIFIGGLLNFEAGLGLALLAASAQPRFDAKSRLGGRVFSALAAASLSIVHIFAALFYLLLLAALAAGARRVDLRQFWPMSRRVLVAVTPCVLAILFMVVISPRLPSGHSGANATLLQDFREGFLSIFSRDKVKSLSVGFVSYYGFVDAACWGTAFAAITLAWRKGVLRLHAGMMLLLVLLGVAFILIPPHINGTAWIDRRFSAMAPLVLLSGLRPEVPGRLAAQVAFAICLAVCVRNLVVVKVWLAESKDLAAFDRAIEPVNAGDKVLVLSHLAPRGSRSAGRHMATGEPTFWHMANLLIIQKHAFVPSLFTVPGKQPIRVLPPYLALSVAEGDAINIHSLQPEAARSASAPGYVANWRRDFDFILVLNADIPDENGPYMPPGVEALREEGFASLYRIKKDEFSLQ